MSLSLDMEQGFISSSSLKTDVDFVVHNQFIINLLTLLNQAITIERH